MALPMLVHATRPTISGTSSGRTHFGCGGSGARSSPGSSGTFGSLGRSVGSGSVIGLWSLPGRPYPGVIGEGFAYDRSTLPGGSASNPIAHQGEAMLGTMQDRPLTLPHFVD